MNRYVKTLRSFDKKGPFLYMVQGFFYASIFIMMIGSLPFFELTPMQAFAAEDPSDYVSLHSFAKTYNYQSINGNTYRETRRGFRLRGDLTDSKLVCGREDYECDGYYSGFLTFYQELNNSVLRFKIYVPPGSDRVSLKLYLPADDNIIVVSRFGEPPEEPTFDRYTDYDHIVMGYQDYPVHWSKLKNGDCFSINCGGHASVFTGTMAGGIDESEAGWVYVKVIAWKPIYWYAASYLNRVSLNRYVDWYTSMTEADWEEFGTSSVTHEGSTGGSTGDETGSGGSTGGDTGSGDTGTGGTTDGDTSTGDDSPIFGENSGGSSSSGSGTSGSGGFNFPDPYAGGGSSSGDDNSDSSGSSGGSSDTTSGNDSIFGGGSSGGDSGDTSGGDPTSGEGDDQSGSSGADRNLEPAYTAIRGLAQIDTNILPITGDPTDINLSPILKVPSDFIGRRVECFAGLSYKGNPYVAQLDLHGTFTFVPLRRYNGTIPSYTEMTLNQSTWQTYAFHGIRLDDSFISNVEGNTPGAQLDDVVFYYGLTPVNEFQNMIGAAFRFIQ